MKRTTNYIDLTEYCTGRINKRRRKAGRILVLAPAIGTILWLLGVLIVWAITRNPSI